MSLAGSFTYQPTPAYKVSKAALNMLTVQYALDLGKEGLIFIAINPGVCRSIHLERKGCTVVNLNLLTNVGS
jgi:NAD(P)-dependent dehydrogenase (short-subunit alcohol dehydrogenase family)